MMKYSVVYDVVRNEPYAVIVDVKGKKIAYGINAHSKSWAMNVNAYSNKDIPLPIGMNFSKSIVLNSEIQSQFAVAFGEMPQQSRRLSRRVKMLLREESEIQQPTEFIFGVSPDNLNRKSRDKKQNRGKVTERMVYPILAAKQKQLFHNVYLKKAVGFGLIQEENSINQIETKSVKPIRNPKGGLTAAGRAHFKRTEGANLKPGVKGAADTPEKMRRKGSFLTRFFTNPSGPMQDEKGEPTRLALSANAWGEPVPKNASDAARLAEKGRNLLKRYDNSKKKSKD